MCFNVNANVSTLMAEKNRAGNWEEGGVAVGREGSRLFWHLIWHTSRLDVSVKVAKHPKTEQKRYSVVTSRSNK